MNYKLIVVLSVFLLGACQNPQGNNVKYNKKIQLIFVKIKVLKRHVFSLCYRCYTFLNLRI